MSGPTIRTDIIDAYVFRQSDGIELLQVRRTREPVAGTWHPVMGHIERGERATDTLWRELAEELSLQSAGVIGAWALEQVHPFFLAELDAVFMSPRFAIEVGPGWSPTLNEEHDAHRWVPAARAPEVFLWPGQRAAVAELVTMLGPPAHPSEPALRLPIP